MPNTDILMMEEDVPQDLDSKEKFILIAQVIRLLIILLPVPNGVTWILIKV
jgi:hypothetical protein